MHILNWRALESTEEHRLEGRHLMKYLSFKINVKTTRREKSLLKGFFAMCSSEEAHWEQQKSICEV